MKKIQLMKVSELSRKIGVDRRTIRRWMDIGKVGSYFGAGRVKNKVAWVNPEEVEDLIVSIKEDEIDDGDDLINNSDL